MEDDKNKKDEQGTQKNDDKPETKPESKPDGELDNKSDNNTTDLQNMKTTKLTFWQCFTVTKYAGIRALFAFVLPLAIIITGAYNWQNINWWLLTWPNVQTALLVVIGVIAVSWMLPWLLGTAIFGHILLPYIGFIMTGTFCYYTHGKPSILVFNNQTYYKYNGGWYSLPDYYLQLLRDSGKELVQIA